jgi:type II secretory pathway pseudopilin PulG
MTRLMLRLRTRDPEAGLTLVEMLVAAAMGVVVVAAAGSMLVSAVKSQPNLSEKSQAVSTARYVLERMTREIRNGLEVYEATGSRVAFKTQVRRTACGGETVASPGAPSIQCKVIYECSTATTTTCTRTEAAPSAESTGTPTTMITGLDDSEVFNYSPDAEEPTYIGVTLRFPDPEGTGNLTITDGAGLRTLGLPN